MSAERTARECADILVTALRPGKALGWQDVLDCGLLTSSEAERALRLLRAAGKIRRSAPSAGAAARAVINGGLNCRSSTAAIRSMTEFRPPGYAG